MDRVRDILLFFSAGMAVFALICAVYQAMNDKLGSAALLAAMFLVCVLVVFIPRLEILEAWGVKAHLVRTIDEAEQLLAKLRRSAVLNAKAAYLSIGLGSRWGVSRVKEKQDMLDEIDNQLRDLNVPPEERRALGATYVRLIGFDLYMVYIQTLERYFGTKQTILVQEFTKSQSADAKAEMDRWRSRDWHPNRSLFESLATYSFEDEVNRATSGAWMKPDEKAGFEAYKNEVISLYRSIQTKGGYTAEAAEYYEKYSDLGGQDKKIIEMFGINPSEPR